MMDDLSQVMSVLNSPDGLKNMMMEPAFKNQETGHEYSQADLVADVINIMRMDSKRIAQAHGIHLEIEKMTPGRAAELLQNVARGEDMTLIEIFDDIEDMRMIILQEIEGDEALEAYMERKQEALYSISTEAAKEYQDAEEETNEN